VGLGSKERPRNRIFGVLLVRKIVREPKRGKRGKGKGKEGRKETLADKPATNIENVIPQSFFAPQPHGNACYAG